MMVLSPLFLDKIIFLDVLFSYIHRRYDGACPLLWKGNQTAKGA